MPLALLLLIPLSVTLLGVRASDAPQGTVILTVAPALWLVSVAPQGTITGTPMLTTGRTLPRVRLLAS